MPCSVQFGSLKLFCSDLLSSILFISVLFLFYSILFYSHPIVYINQSNSKPVLDNQEGTLEYVITWIHVALLRGRRKLHVMLPLNTL